MAHPHPSVWILDFLERTGLTLDHVAAGMTAGDIESKEARDRAWSVNRLALDIYFAVGPTNRNCGLGGMAEQLDRAFERPAGFFAELERTWIEGGCSMEGVRS